ncbi:MAG: hypothetical protein ABW023_02320 [Sphingomonas sp.]
MPEFMGKKITRAEESARHAYRRALEKSLRTLAKGTGWKSAHGSIFRERAGWFIDVSPSVYIYEHVTKAIISVKPMVIDPIFWDLIGLPENREQPLSFRARGAWVCHPPYYAELSLDEDDDPAVVGERLVLAATEQFENVVQSYSLESFLSTCRKADSVDGAYLSSIVPTLIALHRQDEALAICEEARSQKLDGGFLTPEGSFVEMAAAYLRRSAMNATRH